jgi:hypothetical protein
MILARRSQLAFSSHHPCKEGKGKEEENVKLISRVIIGFWSSAHPLVPSIDAHMLVLGLFLSQSHPYDHDHGTGRWSG